MNGLRVSRTLSAVLHVGTKRVNTGYSCAQTEPAGGESAAAAQLHRRIFVEIALSRKIHGDGAARAHRYANQGNGAAMRIALRAGRI
jgi:hypothetical protein